LGRYKDHPHVDLNGALSAELFLTKRGRQMLQKEMFPGRGGHSSILYLGFHNCFYSDRVLEKKNFGTTNKEVRGWVWEENYLNGDTVIEITSILGKRDSRRKMDGGGTPEIFTLSLCRAFRYLPVFSNFPPTPGSKLLESKDWLVLIIALFSV
jgi:hypothetical protein